MCGDVVGCVCEVVCDVCGVYVRCVWSGCGKCVGCGCVGGV